MDTSRLADLLSAPPVLFTLAAGLFLVVMRSPWPWRRTGGAALAAVVLGALGLALRDADFRSAVASAERLPILILVLASAAAAWAALSRTARDRKAVDARTASWKGLTSAELLLGGCLVLGVALAAFVLGAPPAPMADPARAGEDSAAPWFLLAVAELRGYFDPWAAFGLFPFLAVIGLLALPYLDAPRKGPADTERRSEIPLFFLFVWFLLVLLPMTSAAFLERGPTLPLALARPFSELVWGSGPPRLAWLRELPGMTLLATYFLALPRLLPRWRPTRALLGRYVRELGPRRFYLATAFVQLFLLVPLKMYGRWLFGIGYFVYLPELGVNL